ncbi:MAG: transglutaminase family protein [Coriobacteriales bacterium]|nr:transglutaminase family protein [Coriobacteriales bacterium]
MRILSYTFETSLSFSEPVTEHSFVLRCMPKSCARQTVLSSQTIISPASSISQQVDGFENILQIGRIGREHDAFDFASSGVVMVDAEDARPRILHPVFTRPSRYTMPNAQIEAFAAEVVGQNVISGQPESLSQAACEACSGDNAWKMACDLNAALATKLEYMPGETDTSTTAAEAFELGRGVCQDFAHILITCCRLAKIPARYASGLMLGEGKTHAWVDIFDGVRWRGIDPTHACIVDDKYITIAHGRDFSDCPIEVGVFTGSAKQHQEVQVKVTDQAAVTSR